MQYLFITYNLRLNTPNDNKNAWTYRKKGVFKYLNDKKPLIIGTQEGLDDMLIDFKESLPNYDYIGVSRNDNQYNGEYSAIFYNKDLLKVRAYQTFWISKTPLLVESSDYQSAFPRIITYGEFYFKTNPKLKFRVFNTHLDHISDLARLEGVKLIKRLMNKFNRQETLPTIIMGDFNATKFDKPLQFLNAQKDLTYVNNIIKDDNYGTTYHEYTSLIAGDPIDHIFVTNDIKVIDAIIYQQKVLGQYLSDHYPVESILEF